MEGQQSSGGVAPDEVDRHLEELNQRVKDIRSEMIHPKAARLVLEDTEISEEKASELVETMLEVNEKIRGDDDV